MKFTVKLSLRANTLCVHSIIFLRKFIRSLKLFPAAQNTAAGVDVKVEGTLVKLIFQQVAGLAKKFFFVNVSGAQLRFASQCLPFSTVKGYQEIFSFHSPTLSLFLYIKTTAGMKYYNSG